MSDLKIAVEELSPFLRKLSIELPPSAVDEALAQVYRDLSLTAKVKGFRPGKVPRHVLERTYKADVEREVISQLIQTSYRQAVDERELWPVSEPIVENEKLIQGQPFRYSAQIEVKPKLDPQGYEGIAVTPKAGSSEYTKVLTTFSLPDALPRKTQYFKGNELEKTVEYLDYKAISGKIYRAQNIHIQNVKKKRGTDIHFTDIAVNTPLMAKDFTPEALKSNW